MRIASLILAMLVLVGCESDGRTDASKPPIVATLSRSGGLVGVPVEVKLWSDGVWQSYFDRKNNRRHIGALSPEALRQVTVALSATIVASEDYPAPRESADAYTYTLKTEGRTIRWSEANPDVPESLRRVAELVSSEIIIPSDKPKKPARPTTEKR